MDDFFDLELYVWNLLGPENYNPLARRRRMADLDGVFRALDIDDVQVLLDTEAGHPNGCDWQHLVLLHRAGGSRWVTLTADLTLEVHNLAEEEHIVLERKGLACSLEGRQWQHWRWPPRLLPQDCAGTEHRHTRSQTLRTATRIAVSDTSCDVNAVGLTEEPWKIFLLTRTKKKAFVRAHVFHLHIYGDTSAPASGVVDYEPRQGQDCLTRIQKPAE